MKTCIWLGAIIGGIAGGYVPTLWGASVLSGASILGNTLGGVVGVFVGHRIARALDL